MRYETPNAVAKVLARHAPRKIEYVLDPSVGRGALLLPMTKRLCKSARNIVCVDIDGDAIRHIHKQLRSKLRGNLEVFHGDFLDWVKALNENTIKEYFDCIIMNPPFSARKHEYVTLAVSMNGEQGRVVPVEVAFLISAVSLLKAHGRLLAVLPPSVVSSMSTVWVRRYLLETGAVHYVHELPGFSFPGVESRMYLFVYERDVRNRHLVLLNHDLLTPEKIVIPDIDLDPELRFDFGFHKAKIRYHKLTEATGYLDWRPLGDIADIYRGSEHSPKGPLHAVHTCDYYNGFWHICERHHVYSKTTLPTIRRGDLLISRVGRRCSQSAGKPSKLKSTKCTDCVLIIRPKKKVSSTGLLFALRTVLCPKWGSKLLERGTGAAYLTKTGLSVLLVPTILPRRFAMTYARYAKAVSRYRFDEMCKLEASVRSRLERRMGNCEDK